METLKQSKKLVDILKTDIGNEIYKKEEQILIGIYNKFGSEKVDKTLMKIMIGVNVLATLAVAYELYLGFHNGFDSQSRLSELERKLSLISTGVLGVAGLTVIGAFAISTQTYLHRYDALNQSNNKTFK